MSQRRLCAHSASRFCVDSIYKLSKNRRKTVNRRHVRVSEQTFATAPVVASESSHFPDTRSRVPARFVARKRRVKSFYSRSNSIASYLSGCHSCLFRKPCLEWAKEWNFPALSFFFPICFMSSAVLLLSFIVLFLIIILAKRKKKTSIFLSYHYFGRTCVLSAGFKFW